MKRILFVVGSLRKESFNRKLAMLAEEMIGRRAVVEYLDYSDLPMMNPDLESSVPGSVTRVRGVVGEADGLWIFSPEYNHSYPGHLKNLIDWLSRPVFPGDSATPLVINGKKVALSGAGGSGATIRCREKLTELLALPFIKADVMKVPQTGIVLNPEAWTRGVMQLENGQTEAL